MSFITKLFMSIDKECKHDGEFEEAPEGVYCGQGWRGAGAFKCLKCGKIMNRIKTGRWNGMHFNKAIAKWHYKQLHKKYDFRKLLDE